MKKSKIIIVSVLAVILCVMCVTTSTFSWFTRPQTLKGDSLGWGINYETSVGSGVTMKTYKSTDGGNTYTSEVTDFSNSAGLGAGDRIYYKTDITNSGEYPQSVSLYLSKLTLPESPSGSFYLGVNAPLKTYKYYGASAASRGEKVASTINEQNVYVALHNSQIDKLTANLTSGYVHAWSNDGGSFDRNWSEVVDTTKTGTYDVGHWSSAQTFRIYAAKIKYSNTNFMMYTNGWQDGAKPSIASQNTIGYFEFGNTYYVTALTSGEAAGIDTFYSSARVTAGSTINLAAAGKGTITYESSDTSVAKVTSAGIVTGVKAGTATITATSTGVYGDTITATCTVSVSSKQSNVITDVPIITNLRIEGVSDFGEAATESVYWYIKNDSSSTGLTYTIQDVYMTL